MTTRSARRRLAVALVAIVPLAVAGLFIGSLSDVTQGVERVPAAIVNQDEMVQQTAPDGTESPVLAGRLLVTQLTSDDNQAFDWTITNADEAERMLDDGEVYAVLTVPEDFSASIVSLSTDAPQRAQISVRTDDAHGYLTGAATQAVGVGMTSVFGNAITSQFVSGIYTTFDGLKGSLTEAGSGADQLADGATQLSSGATTLGDGITQLGDGIGQSEQGASQLADGLGTYTGGVSQLSSGARPAAVGGRGPLAGVRRRRAVRGRRRADRPAGRGHPAAAGGQPADGAARRAAPAARAGPRPVRGAGSRRWRRRRPPGSRACSRASARARPARRSSRRTAARSSPARAS
ncbi:YhgE/Pip family protein [Clavibacter zhangzhiyongii]|uniref:YhgE/Pip family protein n=1 Tax=Clavibacter zhangzhiyongii TaxID=2768071 RepID=UPI0039E08C2B